MFHVEHSGLGKPLTMPHVILNRLQPVKDGSYEQLGIPSCEAGAIDSRATSRNSRLPYDPSKPDGFSG